jgi:hypothetical protein
MKNYFELAPIFTDNLVFQIGKPIRIFGKCIKNSDIKVTVLDQEIRFKSKTERFLVEFKAIPLQDTAFSITVTCKKQIQVLYNCVMGDVYLFMGGINASLQLIESYHDEDFCDYNIRFYDSINGNNKWHVSGKTTIERISALAYLFSKNIHLNIKSPIGIITLTHENARIFSWMSNSDINNHQEILTLTSKLSNDEKIPLYSKLKSDLLPYSLKAVIFYQGENDYAYYSVYEDALKLIFKCLRLDFKDISLPFIIVQIAGYDHPEADDFSLSMIRIAQANVMDERNQIYLVSAIDFGNKSEVAVKDKQLLANRLANCVLDKLFKIGKNTNSPTFYSYQRNEKYIYIYTQSNYLNLVSKSNKNLGFYYTVNGTDFLVINDVSLRNNQIIISNKLDIKEIRYAMKKYPVCDIYTSNNLPLLPFRIKFY